MSAETKFGNGACEQYEALLEDYLSGDLSDVDARRAAEHWQTCAGCRAALQHVAASVRLLRAAEPSADPGAGFARVVMARIRAAEAERVAARPNFWQPFVTLGWRFAATAALALVALVTYNAGWGKQSQPGGLAARPITVTDLFAPEPVKAPTTGDEVLIMVADGSNGKY
ncbi:MAG TPA: zf-HC2 domain-containing protein [Verrucomicrobiae bacterium]|nr:zf-HC2 domain-containing protein [Verrucomicrobiae bacterium]